MIDVGFAIDAEAVPVRVRSIKSAGGVYDAAGRWVPGVPVLRDVGAVIQPMPGRQLIDVPEGVREEAKWLFWSRSFVNIGDEIGFGGAIYRVLFTWPRASDAFCRAALGLLK